MPERICYSHMNVTGVQILPEKLKDTVSESWWNAYNSSKFNFFPFPTKERDEEDKPFSISTHTWDGKTFFAEKFENGCERLIPSTTTEKPITPITENYSYAFKRDHLIKLFWRMKGMKLKIEPGGKVAPSSDSTYHRFSNFEVYIENGSDFEKANIKKVDFKEESSSGELKKEQELIHCGLGSGGGSGGGYSSVNVGDFCRVWNSYVTSISDDESGSGRWVNGCSVGVDFSKPVIKITKKPNETSSEDEYRPYVFSTCCQQCPRILMEVSYSIGCQSACGIEGYKEYEGCQSLTKDFKRRFRKEVFKSQYAGSCGKGGGTRTTTYEKCSCEFKSDTTGEIDYGVGSDGPVTETVEETSKTIAGSCTTDKGSKISDTDTYNLSEPWTKEELLQCAKENYSKYPEPTFFYNKELENKTQWQKMLTCGARSNAWYEPEEDFTCGYNGWWGNGDGSGGGGGTSGPPISVGLTNFEKKSTGKEYSHLSFSVKEKIYNNVAVSIRKIVNNNNITSSSSKEFTNFTNDNKKTGFYWGGGWGGWWGGWWGYHNGNWYGYHNVGQPCYDYRRPAEIDGGGKIIKSEGDPIAEASFRLDSGAFLKKGKWRIIFIPPQSCYLKIWMKKVTVFYDEITGKEAKRNEEDMPTLVWDGGTSCNSLQSIQYFNQSGEEVEPNTNFAIGNSSCAGISKTFVFISKYSCQRGYEPKELTCKEIQEYNEDPTEKYRKTLIQRNCVPDWVFDKNEDFKKLPRCVYSLEEWHCDL